MSVFTICSAKGSIAALFAAAAVIASAPAFAAPFVSNGHVTEVRYADLDLRDAAGQKALRQRIGAAADEVCAMYSGVDFKTCRVETMDHVRVQTRKAIARAETHEHYAQLTR